MSSEKAWNMFVFRDGRRTVSGATLARNLVGAIRGLGSVPQQDSIISALLRAGELECALTDAGSPSASNAAIVTEKLAGLLLGGDAPPVQEILALVPVDVPQYLKISPPEGFAYYALHPRDFSDMAASIRLDSRNACVIGIRSIGTTLSALVAAALRLRGIRVTRLTARPEGHPYNRQTRLSCQQLAAVEELRSEGASFFIADEGPGMSGSSFLSVGECLVEFGVPRERITFMCSRVADPDNLRAENASERWRSFTSVNARKNFRLPLDATTYLGGGEWRRQFIGDVKCWPATWTQMERLKFLSSDGRQFFKFEGFGKFGEKVHERAMKIGDAGFGPRPLELANGFSTYPVIEGRALSSKDLSPSLIDRMADYCAFRYCEFACASGIQDASQLETMVRFNLAEEFGMQSPLDTGSLHSNRPVIADGKMMPYEWIATRSGKVLKVDGATHGDDHFFPGPTDIAWDLAGAILEWQMDASAKERFVSAYEQRSGDQVARRLPAYLWAYAVFRMGYCSMASAATHEPLDHDRLRLAYDYYRSQLEQKLDTLGMSRSAA